MDDLAELAELEAEELDNQLLEPAPGALHCCYFVCYLVVCNKSWCFAGLELDNLEAALAEMEAEETGQPGCRAGTRCGKKVYC
jgi:hypothetical protein